MLYVNLTSAILSLLYLLIEDQVFLFPSCSSHSRLSLIFFFFFSQLSSAIDFTVEYPESYMAACGLSLAACGGQVFFSSFLISFHYF